MSIEAINAVRKMDIRPCGRKFVAMALADYADETGRCFPSVETLACYTSQSERAVRAHLAALECMGFLTRERTRNSKGQMGQYRYVISHRQNLPVAKFASGKKAHEPAAESAGHNHQTPNLTVREQPETRARGKSDIPTDAECDLFWQAYPESGRVSFAKANLPLTLAPHCARLGIPAVIGAARAYAEAVKRADTKPVSLRNFLMTPALVDQYAKAAKPSGPDLAGEVSLFASTDDDRQRRRRWTRIVGGPCPDEPGCRAPPDILAKHGFNTERASA